MNHTMLLCFTLLGAVLPLARSWAECAAPAECLCPSMQPVAIIEAKAEALGQPAVNQAQLRVLAIHPSTAAAAIPYAVGSLVEMSQYVKSGALVVGEKVLAPVYFEDFNSRGKTYVMADAVGVDADDMVTCSYNPTFRLSRTDTLAILTLPITDCYDELVKRGVNQGAPACDDTLEGCTISPHSKPKNVVIWIVLMGLWGLGLRRKHGASRNTGRLQHYLRVRREINRWEL